MKSTYSKAKAGTELGLGRELLGLFSIFCGLLVVLSLVTFDSRDPWLNHVVSGVTRVHNKAGLLGAYLSGFFYDILGAGSWVLPALLCLAGARRVLGAGPWPWWRWFGFVLLGLCISIAGAASDLGAVEIFAKGILPKGAGNVSTHGGGIVGHMIYVGMVGWLSPTGAFLVWLFGLLLAMQMLTGISWVGLLLAVGCALGRAVTEIAQAVMDKLAERKAARQVAAEQEAREALTLTSEKTVAAAAPRMRFRDAALPPAQDEPSLSGDQPLPFSATPEFPAEGTEPSAWDHAQIQDLSLFETLSDAAVNGMAHPGAGAPEAPALSVSRTLPEETAGGRLRLLSAGKQDEEADLPPWVRDFEEGRLGVPASPRENPACSPGSSRKAEIAGGIPREFFPPAPDEFPLPAVAVEEETDPDAACAPHVRVSGPQTSGAAIPCPALSFTAQAQAQPRNQVQHQDLAQDVAQDLPQDLAQNLARNLAQNLESRMPETVVPPTPLAPEPADIHAPLAPDSLAVLPAPRPDPPGIPGISPAERPVPLAHRGGDQAAAPRPLAPEQASGHAVGQFMEETVSQAAGQTPEQPPIPIYTAPPVNQAPDKPVPGGISHALAGQLGKPRQVPLPPLDLLQAVPATVGATPHSVLEEKGRSLMTCLSDFGIQGELVGIIPGPVVTMFEVRPAPGVRVSRIANLSDDLALALKAVAVRIQAPVPGTDTVGIEIPNAVRETVCLKELLGSQVFARSASLLTLALGKDIAGHPAVADLATMPHLLVAGATGAGKSVGINSIILSLLYKARPEEVQLLLVDPKRVEMAIYADLPHLVHPVVTEMQLAKNALDWAVSEMEQRYNAIARAGVRNIADYNAKVLSWKDTPPEGLEDLEAMPYLVIVIDELADLMLVAAKEVETSIVRLAQLARAAGIHLILATQRPSVDVVTGLIKANFPCRIAFQVTSKHDSRTILDTVGAEHLLGKGDMLFKPGGGKFKRLHGAFVNDQNVNAVVDYWKSQQRPQYQVDFSDWAPEGVGGSGSVGGGGGANGDIASDPMYNEAVEFVRQQGKASISLIQRKFRIGFNKAARFVEQMEQDGIIGPADGSKPRLVNR